MKIQNLQTLQETSSSSHKKESNMNVDSFVGLVVILKDETVLFQMWKLDNIVELVKRDDEFVRTVIFCTTGKDKE